MSISLLEELENLLSETNHKKQKLNIICELVLDLLNPPGTEKNGLFNTEKNDKSPFVQVFEESSNMSSSLGESLESVTQLIALGKHVRDISKLEKKKSGNPVSDTGNRSLPRKDKLDSVTQQVACNKKISSYQGFHKGAQVKIDNNHSKNIIKKTDFLSVKKGTSLQTHVLPRPETRNPEEVRIHSSKNDKHVTEASLNTERKSALSKLHYTHVCSLPLSNLMETLKMPEELRVLLKHRYYYEKHKENLNLLEKSLKPSSQTFKVRFQNVIKLRLNNDLKANIKHTERYLKYLDIAEEITKSKLGEFNQGVEYSSVDDLQLYEGKTHQIMELKIKMRLLSVACNQLLNISV